MYLHPTGYKTGVNDAYGVNSISGGAIVPYVFWLTWSWNFVFAWDSFISYNLLGKDDCALVSHGDICLTDKHSKHFGSPICIRKETQTG